MLLGLSVAPNPKEKEVSRILKSTFDEADFFFQGRTPLHLACENGRTEVVAALIEHRADSRLADEDVSEKKKKKTTKTEQFVVPGSHSFALCLPKRPQRDRPNGYQPRRGYQCQRQTRKRFPDSN
jgi:ankyrin repeat protein